MTTMAVSVIWGQAGSMGTSLLSQQACVFLFFLVSLGLADVKAGHGYPPGSNNDY